MLNMAYIHDISVDVANDPPIREYGRKKGDQTKKYTILKNGQYFVHHDWENNQKARKKVAVPCHIYGKYG